MCVAGLVGAWASPSSGATPDGSAPAGDALEACGERVEAEGLSRATAFCFYRVARRERRFAEVRRELEARAAEPGASSMWNLPLAAVWADLGDAERAVSLLEEAWSTLPDATVGDRAYMAINRGQYLRVLGRHDEAEAAYDTVVALGREHGVVEIEVAGHLERGTLLMRRGGDLSEVRALYDRVVPIALRRGSYEVGTKALVARAALRERLGRVELAARDYRRIRERAREAGDAYDEAFALLSMVALELGALDLRDGGEVPASLRSRIEEAQRAVEASSQQHSIAYLACLRADVLASLGRFGRAGEGYARCRRYYEDMGVLRRELEVGSVEALMLAHVGRFGDARARVSAVDRRARARGLRRVWRDSGLVRTIVAMMEGDVERALEHAHRHFDDVELYRELQSDEDDRSRDLSQMSTGYYFVAGSLLREHGDDPRRRDEAFGAVERMRARNLLDGLRRADAMRPGVDDEDERRWQAIVADIAARQRTLLLPSLEDAERERALAELDTLEARERRARHRLAEGRGALGALLRVRFPGLAEVQARLDEREAVLSYQLADRLDRLGYPEGGSWLWVITREAVQVVPLAERRILEARLSFVTGLFARRDGREVGAMVELHRELVAPALARLPASVDRLVIVPDGGLWALPFAALRESVSSPPLAARFSSSLVPSVTSWMRWRTEREPPAAGLLALAQPGLELGDAEAELRRGTLASGLRLGALPRARQEVEAITRIWGAEASAMEVGAEASERFLKASDLSRYGLLHFATHAVMDPLHPDRSAVVLAAGAEGEDGLLQAREIVRLPLDDKVVVLSACSTAAGSFVRGEGVMSLARAFLQGGAQAVVASRWPLADADAVALFERLYLHLDEGRALSEALGRAQRELIEAGAPAAAWAGVVVLGRGDVVLVPRPPWWRWRRPLLGLAAALALGVGAWLAWGRRRAAPRGRGGARRP